jgi:hypothetical protein
MNTLIFSNILHYLAQPLQHVPYSPATRQQQQQQQQHGQKRQDSQ